MSKFPKTRPGSDPEPLKFPLGRKPEQDGDAPLAIVAEDALAAIESMSRKIDDLARELNCLGYFDDDDDDRPRAA